MSPQAIIAALDKCSTRTDFGDGTVGWASKKVNREWLAQFDADGQPLWVECNIRPGVWIERETKFSKPL